MLYDDADIVIRNREVAALDDSGRLNFDVMRPCTIQVCVPHHHGCCPALGAAKQAAAADHTLWKGLSS